MDKHSLRQSAVASFMQSLEYLDELLGTTADAIVLDEHPQVSESDSDKTDALVVTKSHHQSMATNRQPRQSFVNPDADA